MKAIVQHRYGSPDMLELLDIEQPIIRDHEVLVKVHAASVNALDWHTVRGMPFLIRLDEGLRKPKHQVRGVDLAGQVEAVGRAVTRFKPGDPVFGGSNGSFAEYAATVEDRLALIPSGFTFEQAAALHIGGLTALQGLRDKANLQLDQRVLINGAGGGVGTFAVQIAKWLGAHVTAVTRTESIDTVRAIGADKVIDRNVEDFTRSGERYEVLFDIGGTRRFADCRRVMTERGTMVVVGAPAGRWLAPANRMLHAAVLSPFVSQRVLPFISRNDHAGLLLLKELAEAGKLYPVIDRQYALSEAPEAISYVGAGRAKGKIIIKIR